MLSDLSRSFLDDIGSSPEGLFWVVSSNASGSGEGVPRAGNMGLFAGKRPLLKGIMVLRSGEGDPTGGSRGGRGVPGRSGAPANGVFGVVRNEAVDDVLSRTDPGD